MRVGRLLVELLPREPSGLRHLVDALYGFAHEITVRRVRQRSEFGTCPHAVDRAWNRFVYPVVDTIEAGA